MEAKRQLSILGGGTAGLGLGYYAKKNGLPFEIFEASGQIGGNCSTYARGGFRLDSGAHRFHDKDKEITATIKNLLGNDLFLINVPSKIYHHGKLIDFPLSPLNLLKKLGPLTFIRAAIQVLVSRFQQKKEHENFESYALQTYGRIIAEKFLLNYSEKLWGVPCSRLSTHIAGTRLKGLNLKTFLTEAFLGSKAKTTHLEGASFFYPRGGIATISDKLGEYCGPENIFLNHKITKIKHDGKKILSIEINGTKEIAVQEVVSTLALDYFLDIMDPPPPQEIMAVKKGLRYRNIVLVAVFLEQNSVTDAATIYFPDDDFRFSRVYEPKNRYAKMAPSGKTSLVAEIPCQPEDDIWKEIPDQRLADSVIAKLIDIGWIKQETVLDSAVYRVENAYPILETGFELKVKQVNEYLAKFSNLNLSGRNGRFIYSWIHDMMRFGKTIIEKF
jgi:protoporphyrinogen oxidase